MTHSKSACGGMRLPAPCIGAEISRPIVPSTTVAPPIHRPYGTGGRTPLYGEPTRQRSISLPVSVWSSIDAEALATGSSVSSVVRSRLGLGLPPNAAVLARTPEGQARMQKQLQERQTRKSILAKLQNPPEFDEKL